MLSESAVAWALNDLNRSLWFLDGRGSGAYNLEFSAGGQGGSFIVLRCLSSPADYDLVR